MLVRPGSMSSYLPTHSSFFTILVLIWIIVSYLNGKLHRDRIISFRTLIVRIIISNLIATSFIALAMFISRDFNYSRIIVLGTVILATTIELVIGILYVAYKKALVVDNDTYDGAGPAKMPCEQELVKYTNGNGIHTEEPYEVHKGIAAAIINECGAEMSKAILQMTGRKLKDHTAVLSTTTVFNITGLVKDKYKYIINLRRINDIQKLNDFLNAVNNKLDHNGYFFCCVETKDQRKLRILNKYPPVVNYIYYFFNFIFKRVFPKLKLTHGLYFFITQGKNSVISRAEALGRLSRAGFIIQQESFIGNQLFIEAMKCREPFPVNGTYYGPLIALPRVGKDGKFIKVYKLRTMHPYSEYIQDYVYKLYDLQDGGKFRNDFRITSWGGVCRKLWIDELPMFINFLKGDMKFVGVRPLSKQYFELYRPDVKERRIKYKPGLIPPYYADMPEDLEGIQSSELKYLDSFDNHPIITDFRYFFKSIWNIMYNNARSN
jgi:lipopolysaccharide/colanic/teichoic acid biosynthesis glycosyltransferase